MNTQEAYVNKEAVGVQEVPHGEPELPPVIQPMQVMVIGESGTGKSASIRNMNPRTTLIIQTTRKPLPFKSSEWAGSVVVCDEWKKIIGAINKAPSRGKSVVIIDDFQYMLANEFMRRAHEKGFDKFTEIAEHAWKVMLAVNALNDNLRVYFLTHSDTDQHGTTRMKTIGKLLDEKITCEGLFSIVLRTVVSDGKYMFSTQNSGHDTVKSPMGMFDADLIENDLAAVDAAICKYYNIQG